jgi:dihydrofolate synthase/folylpolyglutamate synthase
MDYKRHLDYLYGLQKYGIKFGLKNITQLLASLNNPQKSLRAVHIGGTNGKGSTASFIASALVKAGYKVGLYTSPHLIRFTERIQINEKEIAQKRVIKLTERIRTYAEKLESITFFEFTTAMALLYFTEEKVDIAILEVGMGGRLDATNIMHPLLSIITNIALDHQQYLGNTISKIAFEKAGIIKKRSILITAATQPGVLRLFKKRCDALETAFYQIGNNFIGIAIRPQVMDYQGISGNLSNVKIGLAGPHQVTNAATALGALEILREKGYRINEKAIRSGLKEARWPGRLEVIQKKPLIVLDGAHNPAAIETLKEAIKKDPNYHRMFLILGIMADKALPKIIKEIAPLAFKVILTRPHMDRSAPPALLKKHAEHWCKNIECVDEVKDAVASAITQAGRDDLVLITGSLFTVGEARGFLYRQ